MQHLFLKKSKVTFCSIKLKGLLYKHLRNDGKQKNKEKQNTVNWYIYNKRKRIEEIQKVTGNEKYNELILYSFFYNKNIKSTRDYKRIYYYCNLLKCDILTFIKKDIENLRKQKYKYFTINNRRHSFKKILYIYLNNNIKINDNDQTHYLFELLQKHLLKTSPYNIFLFLKLCTEYKYLEKLKIFTLDTFIKKINKHMINEENKKKYEHAQKNVKYINRNKQNPASQMSIDKKSLSKCVNVHKSDEQNEVSIKSKKYTHIQPQTSTQTLTQSPTQSSTSKPCNYHDDVDLYPLTSLTYEYIRSNKFFTCNNKNHTCTFKNIYMFDVIHFINNNININHNDVHTNDKNECASEVSDDHIVFEQRDGFQKGAFNNLQGDNIGRNNLQGDNLRRNNLQGDNIKNVYSRESSLKNANKKCAPLKNYLYYNNNHRFELKNKFNNKMKDNDVSIIRRDDHIDKSEVKYFYYIQRKNNLGVYKEIYEKSDQYKMIKYYEELKKRNVKTKEEKKMSNTTNKITKDSITQECLQNNKLRDHFKKIRDQILRIENNIKHDNLMINKNIIDQQGSVSKSGSLKNNIITNNNMYINNNNNNIYINNNNNNIYINNNNNNNIYINNNNNYNMFTFNNGDIKYPPLFKEHILNILLSFCINNYQDNMYKYLKYFFFSNFYFYNPIFLFYYFSFISCTEKNLYEIYLKEFIKFLNNIIVQFHFYLLPFFLNLNYSNVFLNFFIKYWNTISSEKKDMSIIYRLSNTTQYVEKQITLFMNLFLQIYSSDAIIEKGKDTYLENLFLYDTNKESNKEDNIIKDGDSTKEKNDFISKNKSCHHTIHNEEDEKLLIGTIFFNFMKYKGLFNKYETDIKNMNIQKKQVFNNEIININNVNMHMIIFQII
ncbi:hypothetical protein PFFCH_02678 [Plasmodium falciparum FCH/4]|uniref:Uncharacterized protein n=1 Tax=Plasmodium falciparum FCH/4 TaxID=1036724 RepID=A0A024VNZ0_PLAFA|nr:hypothetical protein PFFCH_02678 [Plasmodium falciparum FCH/4]